MVARLRGRHRRVADRILVPVVPNAGTAAMYRRRVENLIDAMHKSIVWWISARWRSNPPVKRMAADELPARSLMSELGRLERRWKSRFDDVAPSLAEYFAKRASQRVAGRLEEILREGGMTVEFKLTRAHADAMAAIVDENVALIKSIAEEHLAAVRGHVMRSVSQGRDLKDLVKALEEQFGVTRSRAELIARDQNNKATAALVKLRQQEAGIRKARWVHSGAGKHPRPEHVAFSQGRLGGPIYNVDKGAFLEGKWTWPGVEISCRCISRPIVDTSSG